MNEPHRTPLRQIRLAAGLSIKDVEILAGINRGRLSIIERGDPPSDDEATRILVALRADKVPEWRRRAMLGLLPVKDYTGS
jgi:transcriptional regulator with XRE-family HTH domain